MALPAALILVLTGCGSGGAGGDEAAGSGSGEASSSWAADACKTLPAEAAAKAAGLAVSEAKLSGGAEVGTTQTSTCSYTAGADSFTVLLRHSPDSTLEEGMAGLKANPEMTGPMEEVTLAAGQGFWAPQLKTFTLLTADGKRLISVTPPGVRLGGKSDAAGQLKSRAAAIAEAAAKAG